jgi:hypothetical protein
MLSSVRYIGARSCARTETLEPETLMRGLFAALALTAFVASPALADRPVTEEERAKLVALLEAEGCTGGEMEFDDGKFEIDDADCADGHEWDFEFDRDFRLIKKELDD